MNVLRFPGQPRPTPRRQYGECDQCHRLRAIVRVLGYLANGEPYGFCQTCTDMRERPAQNPAVCSPKGDDRSEGRRYTSTHDVIPLRAGVPR